MLNLGCAPSLIRVPWYHQHMITLVTRLETVNTSNTVGINIQSYAQILKSSVLAISWDWTFCESLAFHTMFGD